MGIKFGVTDMSDRKRCPICKGFVDIKELDGHAKSHGYGINEVYVEWGITV